MVLEEGTEIEVVDSSLMELVGKKGQVLCYLGDDIYQVEMADGEETEVHNLEKRHIKAVD
ncbi:MAG: hypothetical protein ABEK59_03960 [Halobacteria archaeon]